MANRVNKALDAAQVTSVRNHLSDVLTDLRNTCVVMTADERQMIPKARKNFEKFLKIELQVAAERGINIPAYPVDDIKNDLLVQEEMSLLMDQISTLYTMICDTYRCARSEAWEAFLNHYHVLNALAIQDPELKTRMKPIIEFMSHSSRKSDDSDDNGTGIKEIE